MDNITAAAVNVPASVLCIFVNSFYFSCVFFPKEGERRFKQPLKMLLASVVTTTLVLQVIVLEVVCIHFAKLPDLMSNLVTAGLIYFLEISMTSSVWLNVFYYFQIVPVQKRFLRWAKKNLKRIIYLGLITERFYLWTGAVSVSFLHSYWSLHTESMLSGTALSNTTMSNQSNVGLLISYQMCFTLNTGYMFMSLMLMVTSSCGTACYLHRHMKNMKESRSTFSSQHLRSQLRVTITGVMQAAFYSFCSAWIITCLIFQWILGIRQELNENMFYFVVSLNSLGTTINLGVGQSLFRQRVAVFWQKLQQRMNYGKK